MKLRQHNINGPTLGRCWKDGCPVNKQLIKIYIIGFIALFANFFSITIIFPFLPFMVKFLLPELDDASVGKYAGILATSFFLGGFLGCYVWGAIADSKGRKPVLTATVVLVGLFVVAFGFSVHFSMAVIFRFLQGIANGTINTVKAIFGEVSDDRSNAIAMNILAIAWVSGSFLGPAISGAIADPINQYNLTISNPVINGFLTRFPYSLPCLLSFLMCVVATLVIIFFLPETLQVKCQDESETSAEEQTSDCREDSGSMEAGRTSFSLDTDSLNSLGSKPLDQSGSTDDRDTTDTPSGPVSLALRKHHCQQTDNGFTVENSGSSCGIDSDCASEPVKIEFPLTTDNVHRVDSSQEHMIEAAAVSVNWNAKICESKCQEEDMRKLHSVCTDAGGIEKEGRRKQKTLILKHESTCSSGDERLIESEVPSSNLQTSWSKKALKCAGKSMKMLLLNSKMFLRDRGTFLSVGVYCVFNFAVIGIDEIYSLWAATPTRLGGLEFSVHQIGISLAISTGITLPFIFLLFPALEKCFGSIKSYQMSVSAYMFLVVILPSLHFISFGHVLWVLLCLMLCLMMAARQVCYGAIHVLINNSVTPDKLGAVNGYSQSLVSLVRAFSPVISGVVYSASLSEATRAIGFPLDYHLIFVIFGVVFLFSALMVACLPERVNRQPKNAV